MAAILERVPVKVVLLVEHAAVVADDFQGTWHGALAARADLHWDFVGFQKGGGPGRKADVLIATHGLVLCT
jgi:hypothetical protein